MDIRDLDKDELARMIFSGFHHYWNMEACRKVAGEIVEKEWGAEERIEVGDTVKIKHGKWAGLEMEVFWSDIGATDTVLLKIGRDVPHREEMSNLTLIHKGSKKYVLEGVEVDHCIPPGYFVFSGTGELAGSGIKGKLRMTLEEMAK